MRLLVKANPAAMGLRLGPGAPRVGLRPLMPSVDGARAGDLGVAAPAAWHVTEELEPGAKPWDRCHALAAEGLGIGPGDGVVLAEPDLEQLWLDHEPRLGFGGDRAADCARLEPQSEDYPRDRQDGWFAQDKFSGLATARRLVGEGAPTVRIAHLDTGYDPRHRTKPARLLEAAGLNFADPGPDGAPSRGAEDRKTAEVNPNFGHGTGTLALLAGEGYGGARGFEVLPLRVANWVVLFRNGAIAAALDHVHALAADPARRCDVVSMSMGGLASAAWADAVNALYEAGIVVVTAAGNNYGNEPVRSIVYPARFNRVLAACGVMANFRPYADLPIRLMAGCYGPERKMRTALAAFTPNVPWARYGCPDAVDQDGGGTSAATPQVAAAAALWLHHHRAALRDHRGWRRVEAVRDALFRAAARAGDAPDPRLGRGRLAAHAALPLAPAPVGQLRPEAADATDFAVLRLLTGLGAAPVGPARQRMLELEALQISQRSKEVDAALRGLDPGDPRLAATAWREVLTAVADHPGCSDTLKDHIGLGLGRAAEARREDGPAPPRRPAPARAEAPEEPPLPEPRSRRLRIYAFDPALAARMDQRRIATATIDVPWERDLLPGPVGEYVEVVDVDHASQRAYPPVDLNRPELLAQDGLPPSEGSPQFHQQMAYAVAMKTIGHFRRALGRTPLWADRTILPGPQQKEFERRFVRRLRIYPHALRQDNAFYSPPKVALLLGYFRSRRPGTAEVLTGGMVFTCLSQQIVAHETTHALLDGLHPRWKQATNPDMPGFHEAFSDLTALFQNFTMPEAVLAGVRKGRGGLREAGPLGELAQQFGIARGGHGALRDAIGQKPGVGDYEAAKRKGPHDLGAVLVAAVFDAWITVYEERAAELVRLATDGTGVLPPGDIPQTLAERLAAEAAKVAGSFLDICIRALDYCPPVDLTFGDYLRAMITADAHLVPDDPWGYRVALVEGFRRRGILPNGVQTWSPEAMIWERPSREVDLEPMREELDAMTAGWRLDGDRFSAWASSRNDAKRLHGLLMQPAHAPLRAALGLREPNAKGLVVEGLTGDAGGIEVHSVRPLRRVGPDGQVISAVVIELTQRWTPEGAMEAVHGGCTIIWDRTKRVVRYVICKPVGHAACTKKQGEYRMAMAAHGALRGNYFHATAEREPFALLHSED